MVELMRRINGEVKVILNSKLFGSQTFIMDKLVPLEDEHRLGVIINGQDIFLIKNKLKNVEYDGITFTASDDMFTLIVTKL